MEKYRDLLGSSPIWDPEVIPSADRDASDEEAEEVSLDSLRELLELGVGLPPHPVLEKALGKLQGLLDMSEKIEEKASNFLQAKYDGDNILNMIQACRAFIVFHSDRDFHLLPPR